MTDQQLNVLNWLHSDRDYVTGTSLYMMYGKNKILKQTFPNREARYKDKLKYELCKSVGLNWNNLPPKPDFVPQLPFQKHVTLPVNHDNVVTIEPMVDVIFDPAETKPNRDISQYPEIIKKLIFEYSKKYKERGVAHKELTAIPWENNTNNNEARRIKFDQLKNLTKRLDILYHARNKYESAKELPDPSVLWQPSGSTKSAGLPEGLDELRILKKKLQNNNSKDHLRLNYRTPKKLKMKCPLPEGAKRLTITKRINKRKLEIEAINIKIANLAD